MSKNYTDALVGRQHITACCAIPEKHHRDGICLEAHPREPKLNKGASNNERAATKLLFFEQFHETAPTESALQKKFSGAVLRFLIRPFSLHTRSGPLTPGQGWSGRYFLGHARCEPVTPSRDNTRVRERERSAMGSKVIRSQRNGTDMHSKGSIE